MEDQLAAAESSLRLVQRDWLVGCRNTPMQADGKKRSFEQKKIHLSALCPPSMAALFTWLRYATMKAQHSR